MARPERIVNRTINEVSPMRSVLGLAGAWAAPFCCSAALMLCGPAHAAAAPGIYCDSDPSHRTNAMNIFGAKVLANGRLRFGITKWEANGHSISVVGTAARHGSGWEYREGMHGPADGRCRIFIRTVDGEWLLKSDPIAGCRDHGGYGAEIGTVRIRKSSRIRSVGHELDSLGTFNEDLKC